MSPPAVGRLGFQQNGGFWYEPAPGFVGDVSFVYKAGDGQLKTAATVTLHVLP